LTLEEAPCKIRDRAGSQPAYCDASTAVVATAPLAAGVADTEASNRRKPITIGD